MIYSQIMSTHERHLSLRERLKTRRKAEELSEQGKRSFLRAFIARGDETSLVYEEDYEAYARAKSEELPEKVRDELVYGLCGYSPEEVSRITGLKPRTVISHWSEGRKILEDRILLAPPLHLYRVTKRKNPNENDRMLSYAVKAKALKHHTILGTAYSTRKQLSDFAERELAEEDLAKKGYVLLNEATSLNQYHAIIKNENYSRFLVRRFGRIYIHQSHLTTILPILRTLKKRETHDPDYVSVNESARTAQEAFAVRNELNRDRIEYVGDQEKKFVKRVHVKKVLEEKRRKNRKRKRAITRQS